MSTPLRQSRLPFGTKRKPARSPSPDDPPRSSSTAHLRRQPITHNFVDQKRSARERRDQLPSDGEDLSHDDSDDEPQLASVERRDVREQLFDFEAEESSGSGSDDGGRSRGKRRKRYSDEETEEDEQEVEVQLDPKRVRGKVKGKNKAREIVVSSSSSEDEAPKASTSKSTLPAASTSRATASATPQSPARPRKARAPSRSVFEGVIIDVPPRKRARATVSPAKPASAKEKGKGKEAPVVVLEESEGPESDEPVRPSQRAMKRAPLRSKTGSQSSKGKGTVKKPSPAPAHTKEKGKKRTRAASSSSSSASASPAPSSASDSDALPVPSSLRRKPAAPKKPAKKRTRKLATLSQGFRDRRSADEASGSEDFIVDDDDELRYDTEVEEEANEEEKRRLEREAARRRERDRAEREKERERREREGRAWKNQEEGADGENGQGEGGEEEEEEEDVRPKKRPVSPAKGKGRAKAVVSDEEDDDVVVELAKQPLKGKEAAPPPPPAASTSKGKRQPKSAATVPTDSDDDADSEEVGAPSQRRKGKAAPLAKKDKKRKGKEKEKLKEKKRRRTRRSDDEPDDLEILDEITVVDDKLRKIKTNEGKFAALKAARERRQASTKKLVVLDSDDSDSTPRPASTSASQKDKSKGKAVDKPKRHRPRYAGASSSSSSSSSGEGSEVSDESSGSEDIDKFIVEEEDDEKTRRIVEDFRAGVRGKSQGIKWSIKTYLQYLIHNIVCPEVDWLRDPDFKQAEQHVIGHIDSLLASLLKSQAWKPKFGHALDTRPELTIDEFEGAVGCEACSKHDRVSKFIGTLKGRKYDRKTFRPVTASDDSSDSSADSSDEEKTDDENDKYPKMKEYEFNLGSFCAGRGAIYHDLRHWAIKTRERMSDLLDKHGRQAPPSGLGKVTSTMSRKEKEETRARLASWKTEEAKRLSEALDDGGYVIRFAGNLQKEIQDAVEKFTKK
ncbi:hypothetical protein JCM8097_000671 [Rhodosporidiobolus ruineniae]